MEEKLFHIHTRLRCKNKLVIIHEVHQIGISGSHAECQIIHLKSACFIILYRHIFMWFAMESTRENICEIRYTNWIHFKVDELTPRQSNHHLSLIDCTLLDIFLAWGTPFINTLVCTNVSNTIWINLHKVINLFR